jgi:hypothetical protein
MFDLLLDVAGDIALVSGLTLAVVGGAISLYCNWRGVAMILGAIKGKMGNAGSGFQRLLMEGEFKAHYRREQRLARSARKKAIRERQYKEWKAALERSSEHDSWRI